MHTWRADLSVILPVHIEGTCFLSKNLLFGERRIPLKSCRLFMVTLENEFLSSS
jgi:hypothetical protein